MKVMTGPEGEGFLASVRNNNASHISGYFLLYVVISDNFFFRLLKRIVLRSLPPLLCVQSFSPLLTKSYHAMTFGIALDQSCRVIRRWGSF